MNASSQVQGSVWVLSIGLPLASLNQVSIDHTVDEKTASVGVQSQHTFLIFKRRSVATGKAASRAMGVVAVIIMRALVDTSLHHGVSVRVNPATPFRVGDLPDMTPFAIRVIVLLLSNSLLTSRRVVCLGGICEGGRAEEQRARKDLPCSTHDCKKSESFRPPRS
jgi:hypothetical protein